MVQAKVTPEDLEILAQKAEGYMAQFQEKPRFNQIDIDLMIFHGLYCRAVAFIEAFDLLNSRF